jgi:2,4-dienoyl-CoA reductase-like NADH-dependent reductase (Old Yellow Enzyme family)
MKLLSPIQIGPVQVKNRVVSTAHSAFLDFYRPGSDGERYMAYQERRAAGGTGLIIMTAMHVHPSSQIPNHFMYDPDDMAIKFRKISDRLHAHGARVVSQLFHFGVQGKSDSRDDYHPLWGFSGTVSDAGEASHKMTDEEIEEVIDSFARAARVAVENGVDGVELHGTHGYLIQQSFSPFANQRDDKWGEDLYFAKTLAKRVREAIGPDKALGFRISADDFIRPEDGGVGHARLCQIAGEMAATSYISYLNHSEGAGGAHYARAIASYRYPFGEYLPLTRGLREAVAGMVPVIGVGKISTPDLAERALQDGDCDLVGMTRAQISDPDLVKKISLGQASRIRTCTGANQGCIDRTGSYPITCIHNPEVGEENRFKALDLPIERPKRILVVGGGPAGIKAAEIAARRGHHVTLAEAGQRIGGRLNLVEPLGAASNLLTSVSWIEQELAILNVPILTQTKVNEEFVRDFRPDGIVLATGAISTNHLDIPTDGSVPVISSDDAAAGLFEGQKFDMKGTRSVFIDRRANYESSLVIEAVAKRGSLVTVATPYLQFGVNTGFTHLLYYLKEFPALGVDLRTSTAPVRIADGKITLREVFSNREAAFECDFIVAGTHPIPCLDLYEALRKYAPTTIVGDVVAPRSAMEAFREGDRAGRTI